MNWLLQLFGYHAPGQPPSRPERRCVRCDGRSGHPVIAGEGTPVCVVCVSRNGRVAADPSLLTSAEAEQLLTEHGDVVALVRVDLGITSFWRWSWREGEAA